MLLNEAIERYWGATFGLAVSEDLWTDGVKVTGHGPEGTLADYSGMWVVRRGGACRVSVPPDLLTEARSATRGLEADELANATVLKQFFEPRPVTLGPSLHGYADANMLQLVPKGELSVEEVTLDDLSSFKDECPEDEWNEGGFATHDARFFALTKRHEILAAANLTNWLAKFDDVGLIVHPKHRGNGFGAVVASYAAAIAVDAHEFARYRVLETNSPSVAIQRKLGFEIYCEQTAVRSARIP